MEEYKVMLCGFIFEHGEKDYSKWIVDITPEDEQKIMEILSKYEAEGSSERGFEEP